MPDILIRSADDKGAIRRFVDLGDGTFAEKIIAVQAQQSPAGSTALLASSGNVANAAAVATLAAVATKTNYLSGFEITGAGATAASIVLVTVTGLLGGTMTFNLGVVAGATAPNSPLLVTFNPALPASAANTAITVSVPALGAGNTNSAAVAHGYQS